MRLVGIVFSLFILPVVVTAQTMQPLPAQLDAQNVHNFFSALDAVIAGKASTNKNFDDFVAKSKTSTDLKGYWDSIFKDYIKAGEDFARSKGVKLQFTDDTPSIQKAMELRKLHLKLKPLAKAPASESEFYIFPSTQTAANIDKLFGTGSAEKVGITKERNLGYFDRVYKFDKPVSLWNLEKSGGSLNRQGRNGVDQYALSRSKNIVLTVTFEDQSTKVLNISELAQNSDEFTKFEIDRNEDTVFIPKALLKSSDVGSKKAIVALKDGSFEFRDTLGAVASDNKIIIVDNADAIFEALTKTATPKKGAMKNADEILEFVVPGLEPKVCSTLT